MDHYSQPLPKVVHLVGDCPMTPLDKSEAQVAVQPTSKKVSFTTTMILSPVVLLLLGGSACTKITVSVHQPTSTSSITGTHCQLQRELRNQAQQTDYWCWAASAHTVIQYLKQTPIQQCDIATAVFQSQLNAAWPTVKSPGGPSLPDPNIAPPSCCMSTAVYTGSATQENIKIAKEICWKNGWPEDVFTTQQFHMNFEGYEYDSPYTYSQGLSWEEIVGEICADRPMISAILFTLEYGGGAHVVVIGGYSELGDGSQWVHVYDPGYNTLEDDYYLWPYNVYLGDPGVFTHIRDYKGITLP